MPSSLSAFQWLPVVSINNVAQLAGVSLAAIGPRGVAWWNSWGACEGLGLTLTTGKSKSQSWDLIKSAAD